MILNYPKHWGNNTSLYSEADLEKIILSQIIYMQINLILCDRGPPYDIYIMMH